MKNLEDLSPVYFTLTVMLVFFLTLYPRKRKGDYPNDPISEWCRQLPYQELNNVQNIPSVHPVNDIYSPPPPQSQSKTTTKNL